MPKGLRPITTYNVWQGAKTVVKNTTETSVAFDLGDIAQNGVFSVQYLISGDGTVTLAYTVCSTKSGTYYTPTGAGTIVAGLTKTSGNGAGLGGLSFTIPVYPFIKITASETVNSANAVVTVFLNVQ